MTREELDKMAEAAMPLLNDSMVHSHQVEYGRIGFKRGYQDGTKHQSQLVTSQGIQIMQHLDDLEEKGAKITTLEAQIKALQNENAKLKGLRDEYSVCIDKMLQENFNLKQALDIAKAAINETQAQLMRSYGPAVKELNTPFTDIYGNNENALQKINTLTEGK